MGILAKSTPELQGISSEVITAFIDEVNTTVKDGLHSMLLMRHGKVVAEGWWAPYEPADPHIMFSLSKSFTSTAIGFAVAEGRLKVTDPVTSFFPEEVPEVISPNLAAMQVRHLLSMSTGHATDTVLVVFESAITNWARAILAYPVEYEPGTHFLYNTGATYLLSAILQKVTGETLLDYLKPRLFEPLGIENPGWEINPEGITTGGYGLGITTADVARLGQLYLQKGAWEGQQLLSREWVAEASSAQVSNGTDPESDWTQGYGYQIWRCRHGAYRGDGAFGQVCLVMPEQDAVLAITAGLLDIQTVLNLVWKHLLPAMGPGVKPPNPAANEELARKLGQLKIAPAKDLTTDTVAALVAGKRFILPANELQISVVSFDFDAVGSVLTLEGGFGKSQLACGNGTWRKGISNLNKGLPRKVAASGGWTDQQTYQVNLYFLTPVLRQTPPSMTVHQYPFGLTIKCRFEEDLVNLDFEANLSLLGVVPLRLQGSPAISQ